MTDNFKLLPDKDNYCVMGNPVSHSLSPVIHTLFAEQTGEPVHYQAIQVDIGDFENTLDRFRLAGGKGLNITLPFKPDAYRCADELTDRARMAGAVNTVRFDADGRVCGDNTDGIGLVTDITVNHAVSINGRRILILGAGGAVQGILGPVLEQQPDSLVIANRTVSKAKALVELFPVTAGLQACGFDQLAGQSFDIVLNATSASLQSDVPPLPDSIFNKGALSYDLMYSSQPTVFQEWSEAHGAAISLDGLGMLVEQAAEAFYIWRGVRPETRPVIEALRQK